MIYCFDTSEGLATKTPERWARLHQLLRELAGSQSPLALLLDLLKILTLGPAEGACRHATRYISYGLSVDDFFVLDGKSEEEIAQHRTAWEQTFGVYATVRESFEEVFTLGPQTGRHHSPP